MILSSKKSLNLIHCGFTIQSQLSYVQLLDPDINETSTSEVTIYMTGVEPKGNVRLTSGFTRCGKRESIPNSWFFQRHF